MEPHMTGRRLAADDIARVLAFAAEAPRPLALLDAIGRLAMDTLGARGFTMFRYIHATAEVERIHSSDPVAYPTGGRKRIADYPTNQAVLARGEVYVARGRDDVRATYKDFEKIFALGVTSIMNVPVRFCGANVGAINLFGVEGQFGAGHETDGRILAGMMLPAILAWDAGDRP
jgi:hypothetical protein